MGIGTIVTIEHIDLLYKGKGTALHTLQALKECMELHNSKVEWGRVEDVGLFLTSLNEGLVGEAL